MCQVRCHVRKCLSSALDCPPHANEEGFSLGHNFPIRWHHLAGVVWGCGEAICRRMSTCSSSTKPIHVEQGMRYLDDVVSEWHHCRPVMYAGVVSLIPLPGDRIGENV